MESIKARKSFIAYLWFVPLFILFLGSSAGVFFYLILDHMEREHHLKSHIVTHYWENANFFALTCATATALALCAIIPMLLRQKKYFEVMESISKRNLHLSSRFELITNKMQTGLIEWDPKKKSLWLNNAFYELAGIQKADFELKVENLYKLISEKDRLDFSRQFELTDKDISKISLEFRLADQTKSNSYYKITTRLVHLEKGQGHTVVGIVTDTSRMHSLKDMQNEFFSLASHELRTPLTSIYSAIKLVKDTDENSCKKKNHDKLLSIAAANCERLENLIQEFFDMQRFKNGQETLRTSIIDLGELAKEVEELKFFTQKHHSARLQIQPVDKGNSFVGDKTMLKNVIKHFLSNAYKFSPPDTKVKLSIKKKDNLIRVEVEDQGSGVPKDFRAHIFKPFLQAEDSLKRTTEGAGIGLSICKSIIDLHHGVIGFKDSSPTGSVFYFEVPLNPLDCPTTTCSKTYADQS